MNQPRRARGKIRACIQYRTPNKEPESGLRLDFRFLFCEPVFLVEPLSYIRRSEMELNLIFGLKTCSLISISLPVAHA